VCYLDLNIIHRCVQGACIKHCFSIRQIPKIDEVSQTHANSQLMLSTFLEREKIIVPMSMCIF